MNSIQQLNASIKEYIKYVCREEDYEQPSEILTSSFLGEFFSIGPNTLPLFQEENYCFIKFISKKYRNRINSIIIDENFMNYINNTIDGKDLTEEMEQFESDSEYISLIRKYAWCYVFNMSEEELDSCIE